MGHSVEDIFVLRLNVDFREPILCDFVIVVLYVCRTPARSRLDKWREGLSLTFSFIVSKLLLVETRALKVVVRSE
jgi:hypothetical protein